MKMKLMMTTLMKTVSPREKLATVNTLTMTSTRTMMMTRDDDDDVDAAGDD